MRILVLSKYKLSKRYQAMLSWPDGVSAEYWGVGPAREEDFGRAALKEMRTDFNTAMTDVARRPDGILALGNEALFVSTGHSGIMKHRGIDYDCQDIPVVASVTPAAVERNPGQADLLVADIRGLVERLEGADQSHHLPPEIVTVETAEHLTALGGALHDASAVAFDVETGNPDKNSYDETRPGAFIVSLALTIEKHGSQSCWVIGLRHAESSWDDSWIEIVQWISVRMRRVPERIGHNAKFDCRWLEEFGAGVPATFDTMLAAHLLDENRGKRLKTLSRTILGTPEWALDLRSGKNDPPWYKQYPLADILKYNALDTWNTMRLYLVFREQLNSAPRLAAIMKYIMMPASQSLVHIERTGAYVDHQRLTDALAQADQEIQRLEDSLSAYVPADAPPVNWNPSNFLRWLLFEHLGLPVIARGKTGPSVADDVLNQLAQEYEIVRLLKKRTTWYKARSTYLRPYLELITEDSRLRTTFKLAGTVTGRLASGKADNDKVTGMKADQIKGINYQNVPRWKLIRGLYSAPPGWLNVSFDYSQLELRIAAELAQERTMLALYQQGKDIHMTMAMRMTGKPESAITKEERTRAKAVNFGFLYGMGPAKFVTTAFNDYGVVVTIEEAEAFRDAFFAQFPDLVVWHARQRRLVRKFKRVESPIGRIRHLPDIDSPDRGVQGEAERQAINSPVQAFGSDLCLLSINIIHRKLARGGYRSQVIGNVHDAINLEIPQEELTTVAPMVKSVMENPPTARLFNYQMSVPLVADLSVGTHWGEQTEIKDMDQWLRTLAHT